MPISPFDINQFKNILQQHNGTIRSSHYLLVITPPTSLTQITGFKYGFSGPVSGTKIASYLGSGDVSFFCESSALPGAMLATHDVRRYGVGPSEKRPLTASFNDLQCIFIGNDMVFHFFHEWQKLATNFDSRGGMNKSTGLNGQNPYEVSYKDDYATLCQFYAYDPTGSPTLVTNLTKCYPVLVADSPMAWGRQNEYIQFPVSMTYRDWHTDRLYTTASSSQTQMTLNPTSSSVLNSAPLLT